MFQFLHRRSKTISGAAIVLAAFTFGGQLLSLIRDRLFAGQVGAGIELDTYYYAFRIPDILFAVFSALVSLTVLIPLLSKHKEHETEEMRHTYSTLFTFFCIGASVLILIIGICMPQLVHLVAPGIKDSAVLSQIVLYSRILLFQPFFLGISNLLGSYTQLKERFLLYAISPFIYNLSTVLGLIVLYPHFGMMGVVAAVVVGSVLHGLIQLPFIHKENFLPSFKRITVREMTLVKQVIKQSLPRAFILSLAQIELLYLTSLVSHMKEGSASLLNLANNIQGVPVTLIGVSLVIASFPALSRTYASGQYAEFRDIFRKTLKTILKWAVSVAVLVFIFKKYIVYILLGKNSFDVESLNVVVVTLGAFTIALIPQCLKMFITRGYYASGNTKKPAVLNIFSTVLLIVCATFFVAREQSVIMLATAFAVASWFTGLIFYIAIRKDLLLLRRGS